MEKHPNFQSSLNWTLETADDKVCTENMTVLVEKSLEEMCQHPKICKETSVWEVIT